MLSPKRPRPRWDIIGLGMSRGIVIPRVTAGGRLMVVRMAGSPGLFVLAWILLRHDLPRLRHPRPKTPTPIRVRALVNRA